MKQLKSMVNDYYGIQDKFSIDSRKEVKARRKETTL
jgi:hypothetical protein